MSAIWQLGGVPFGFSRKVSIPDFASSLGWSAVSIQRLPTEPVGSHLLTLTNVVIGSRVFIRDQANTVTLYDQLAAGSTVAVSLPVYSAGSPLNDLSIKVRKSSSAPKYQPYETFQTITVGSSSVFVSQVPDTIAS